MLAQIIAIVRRAHETARCGIIKKENHQKPAAFWGGEVATKSPAFHGDQFGLNRVAFGHAELLQFTLGWCQILSWFCCVCVQESGRKSLFVSR